jgi:signal transduction histidine kinase
VFPTEPPLADQPASVPNPAAPAGRSEVPSSADELRGPSRHLVRAADALPDWVGSIRFRLTALYSLVLFGLAAFVVAGLYGVLAARLSQESGIVNRTDNVTIVVQGENGVVMTPAQIRSSYRSVEQLANERALNLLRSYSLTALGLLFLASLGVGWLVAGRVLAPIGRITAVARDIQATDLSRRIALRGPPDELRELADTFDAMLARLDDAFEGQQRFIQEASHELRNPLAVIRTNIDVALADPNPDPAELRRTAEVVGRTAARMSTLVDDLLVYARRGAPARDLGLLDLQAVAVEATEEFTPAAAEQGVELRAEGAPGHAVYGDRIALRRAVANLLTNAIRHAPSGSTVLVSVARHGDEERLSVSDAGPGIPEDQREKVFERFWRGDRNTTAGAARSGLGLAIVEGVLHDHRGAVTLDGNDRGGSTFTLHLPAADSQETPG